ncbi:MAG: hypothetical protein KGZ49_06365 [Syntrophaceae bacterium]|nr:hypothetical protein [Syntrophaceae bacterium]
MNKRQFTILLIAVIISSFLGGMSIQLVNVASSVSAKESLNYPDEIKTKALHLISQDNKVRASFYLGLHDAPELVLYDREGTNRFNLGLAPAGNPGMSFNDNGFNKLIDINTAYNRASVSIWDSQKNIVWQAPHTK